MPNKKQTAFQTGDYIRLNKEALIENVTRDLGADDEELPKLIKTIQDQEYFLVTSKDDVYKRCGLYHPELNLNTDYINVLEVVGSYPGVDEARKIDPKTLVDESYKASTVVEVNIPMMLAHENFGSGTQSPMIGYALYQESQGVKPAVHIYRKLTLKELPERAQDDAEVIEVLEQGGSVYRTLDGLGAYQSWMFTKVSDHPFNKKIGDMALLKDMMRF